MAFSASDTMPAVSASRLSVIPVSGSGTNASYLQARRYLAGA